MVQKRTKGSVFSRKVQSQMKSSGKNNQMKQKKFLEGN